MKVVLIEWRATKSIQQWGTLGLQYITSALRAEGYAVKLMLLEGWDVHESYKMILENTPDLVGIPIYAETNDKIYEITKLIKQKNKDTIIFTGGHTASLYAAKIMLENKYIDIVCRGEGEETVTEMCQTLYRGNSLGDCKGIFYREGSIIYKNDDRKLIKDLDTIYDPAIDLLEDSPKDNPNLFVSVSTSRGCLGRCEFCVEHRVSKWDGKLEWRGRSPENILNEIQNVKNRFPDKRLIIRFVDGAFEDPFPKNKSRIKRLMDLIEKSNLKLSFSFLTRAESWKDYDRDLIKKMRKLGLFSVSVGFESGSSETLKLLGKRATMDDNNLVCELFREEQILVYAFIMMFQPYSKLDDLYKTAKFLKNRNFAVRPENWTHAMYIYPDTPIYRRASEDGIITGTDKSGFMYQYNFCDDKVQNVFNVMSIIAKSKGVNRFQSNIDKIMQEQELVSTWLMQEWELQVIKEIFANFNEQVEYIIQSAGDTQYEIFVGILNAVRDNKLKEREIDYISQWDKRLIRFSDRLEQIYLNYKMKVGRKRVRTI